MAAKPEQNARSVEFPRPGVRYASNGMVASSSSRAAAAGLNVLQRGCTSPNSVRQRNQRVAHIYHADELAGPGA